MYGYVYLVEYLSFAYPDGDVGESVEVDCSLLDLVLGASDSSEFSGYTTVSLVV